MLRLTVEYAVVARLVVGLRKKRRWLGLLLLLAAIAEGAPGGWCWSCCCYSRMSKQMLRERQMLGDD